MHARAAAATAFLTALTTTLAAPSPAGATETADTPQPVPGRASPATCQGQKATITGRPGRIVHGTSSRDVIISNGAKSVISGDGADLICITNSTADEPLAVVIRSQDGNDTVYNHNTHGTRVIVFNSDGNDLYVGNSGDDSVAVGRGRDTVQAGGGDDFVTAYSPDRSPIRADVTLGPGADHFKLRTVTSEHIDLAAGRGRDTLKIRDTALEAEWWTLRNDANSGGAATVATATTEWTPLTWTDIEVFNMKGAGGLRQDFRSRGNIPERVRLGGSSGYAHAGGGDDRVEGTDGNDVLRGGAGHDLIDGRNGADECTAETRVSCEA